MSATPRLSWARARRCLVPQNAYHGFENNSDADVIWPGIRRRCDLEGCRLCNPARRREASRLGRRRRSSIESVFRRPTTTTQLPPSRLRPFAKRCGCVQSKRSCRPARSRRCRTQADLSLPDQDVSRTLCRCVFIREREESTRSRADSGGRGVDVVTQLSRPAVAS